MRRRDGHDMEHEATHELKAPLQISTEAGGIDLAWVQSARPGLGLSGRGLGRGLVGLSLRLGADVGLAEDWKQLAGVGRRSR